MDSKIVTKADIPGLVWESGKVRDRTEVRSTPPAFIFVTTDRNSAFDVVLPNAIPEKGKVLNLLSIFWKQVFADIIPHDIISWDQQVYLPYLGLTLDSEWIELLKGRTVLARKALRIPVECVLRGYISGSYWEKYRQIRGEKPVSYKVSVFGHELPGDLKEADQLPQPIFTPTTKSDKGHDINLTYEELIEHLEIWLNGQPDIKRRADPMLLGQALKSTSLVLYLTASDYARQRGIIIADTKFEFGFVDEDLTLIDEVLTPDSSHFWDAEKYEPGHSQESLDKQPVRDWLIQVAGWDKEPPAPALPPEVVASTTERYREVYQRLTGHKL